VRLREARTNGPLDGRHTPTSAATRVGALAAAADSRARQTTTRTQLATTTTMREASVHHRVEDVLVCRAGRACAERAYRMDATLAYLESGGQ
jgi:hypothetical protein